MQGGDDDGDAHTASRKRKATDALTRRSVGSSAAAAGSSSSGCPVACPLCGKYSIKTYALGRGMAAHLQAIHTPWKPNHKLAQKIHRRQHEERARTVFKRRRRTKDDDDDDADNDASDPANKNNRNRRSEPPPKLESWEPTQQEMDDWDVKFLQIVQDLEQEHATVSLLSKKNDDDDNKEGRPRPVSYRDSLPPFLQAAAEGNLSLLQTLVDQATQEKSLVTTLLDQKDRNLSSAEHWAAGGGHLECLEFLMNLRAQEVVPKNDNDNNDHPNKPKKKLRRRDGKTCLHYAARNGKLPCVRYLLETQKLAVDEPSGEDTTALHMACYGGHPAVVQYFLDHGANGFATNAWGCSAAHWAAMTLSERTADVHEVCQLLQRYGVSFVARQHQGHSPLHKAAQKKNQHVLQWMASKDAGLSKEDLQAAASPDLLGGHCPSDIWLNLGGDQDFGDWMKARGW